MNNDLRNIWIEVEGQLKPIPEKELRELLLQKSRQIIIRFRWIVGMGITIGAGVLIFLAIASFSLQNDKFYLINNSLLALFVIVALIYNIRLFKALEPATGDTGNVYRILKEKSLMIEKEVQQGKQILLLPVILLLLLFSVNVYFSSGSFVGAFKNEENLWGLAFGFITGLFVAIYLERKINNKHSEDLEVLRNYIKELESDD